MSILVSRASVWAVAGVVGMLAAGVLPGCQDSMATAPTVAPTPAPAKVVMPVLDGAVPSVAVYVHLSGWQPDAPSERVRPIVIAWPDGRVIASADPSAGGPPYTEANVGAERVAQTLDQLESLGLFSDPALARPYYGPDASYMVIAAAQGTRRVMMSSWHELFERSPKNLIVGPEGVSSLGTRSRQEVEAAWPEKYVKYRHAWAEARGIIGALAPQAGQTHKELHFELRHVGVD